jgi:signal transduction histidine kinase
MLLHSNNRHFRHSHGKPSVSHDGNVHTEEQPEAFSDGDGKGIEPLAKGDKGSPLNYQGALLEHLANPSVASHRNAFALGKAALDGGMKMSDVIRLHHQALADVPLAEGSHSERAGSASALESFLLEALMPYRLLEGTRARQLKFLEEQNEALALRIVRLEAEVADREIAEAAMRDSKDRYFQLYQDARAKEADLRQLSAQVLSAQEEERKRISHDLHDEIGQALIAVNVSISILKSQVASDSEFRRNIAGAEQLLAHTMQTVHSFARELRPAMLEHLGLLSALRAHILVFTRQTGIRTELVPHPSLELLDEKKEEVLFRVAQEALSNIVNHAHATHAKIEFTSTGDSLHMVVGDNGCAPDNGKQLDSESTERVGLLGMKVRVRNVNGSLAIDSEAGHGTRVRVRIPIKDAHAVVKRGWDEPFPVRASGTPGHGGTL